MAATDTPQTWLLEESRAQMDTTRYGRSSDTTEPTAGGDEPGAYPLMPLRDGAYSTPYDEGDRKVEEGVNTATSTSVKAHRHHKAVRRLPLLRQANPGDDEPWLKKEDRAISWLSLFYDLVVVTVLGTFSNTHNVRTPDSIPIFFSFFIIVVCIWVSQIHYDVRYEAEDAFHRIFKALQIIVFMFIGASGGGWNPGRIVKIKDVAGDDSAAQRQLNHDKAAMSFLTITLAFAATRALLAVQYLVVVVSGRRIKRRTSAPKAAVFGLALSCAFAVVAAALSASSRRRAHIKVILFYIGVGIDTLTALWQYSDSGPVPAVEIAERYGAFSLIIIGEGFVALSGIFNKAIDGIAVKGSGIYLQVFLVIVVIINLWSFLFSNFNAGDRINKKRTFAWEILHFPLHLSMMLLIAAMVNAVAIDSLQSGISQVLSYLEEMQKWFLENQPPAADEMRKITLFFNRLNPQFLTLKDVIQDAMSTKPPTLFAPTMFYQLMGTFLQQVSVKSGVDLTDAASTLLDALNALPIAFNDTVVELGSSGSNITVGSDILGNLTDTAGNQTFGESPPFTANEDTLLQAIVLLIALTMRISTDVFSGILWLYPVAGATLILCALRSMMRYHFRGQAHYVIHGAQIGVGIALGLLGLLNIGSGEFFIETHDTHLIGANPNSKPIYQVVAMGWAIAIVAIAYTAVTIGTQLYLVVLHRVDGGVFEEHEGENAETWREWWHRLRGKN
ncbi:uncharacterized protein LOC62_02G002637 [Vanrija pseudolonga]|uniref:Low temperature requirement A n=1 Tax=Vanrija pseudolonga TaxID=143232 RepID=A0AAF0Y752_9TREE|nr:hypothetical protein LOC62_02G002637 [Vanrija pseudolonga]